MPVRPLTILMLPNPLKVIDNLLCVTSLMGFTNVEDYHQKHACRGPCRNTSMTWSGLLLNAVPRELAGIQTIELVMEVRLGLEAERRASRKRSVCRTILTVQAIAL